jgi:ABC-type molybdate transport system ATPase subunit
MPMLYISHDAGEIARLADHILYMRDGRILATAPEPETAPSAVGLAQAKLQAMDPAERDRLALAAILAGMTPP